ncbi:MAG TPA: DUF6714 family protein [Anaerolineales bacterium]
MIDQPQVIEKIYEAFIENDYPGDPFLQGSYEGWEPDEEVGPFRDRHQWNEIEPSFLDKHSAALSFFSEAGLRFFLPAFLVADVQDQLTNADPLFHLTHGFSDEQVEHEVQGHIFVLHTGRSVLVNPRRYGAMTSYDYARYRLSIFSREEASAIVEYLKYKRENDELGIEKPRIDAALESFWLERAEKAPAAEDLKRYLDDQKEYLEAIRNDSQKPGLYL